MIMYTATINCADDEGQLYAAIKPEEARSNRFEVQVQQDGNDTKITITAYDAGALKSVVMSMLRLLEAAEKIHNGK